MVLGTSSSISLFCEEDSGSILRRDDYEAPEPGRDLDLSGFARLQLESDKLVELHMAKEREQFTETAARVYLERLNNGGLELSWRTDAIDWICKVTKRKSPDHIRCLFPFRTLMLFFFVFDLFMNYDSIIFFSCFYLVLRLCNLQDIALTSPPWTLLGQFCFYMVTETDCFTCMCCCRSRVTTVLDHSVYTLR
jgi:hypothetical protein